MVAEVKERRERRRSKVSELDRLSCMRLHKSHGRETFYCRSTRDAGDYMISVLLPKTSPDDPYEANNRAGDEAIAEKVAPRNSSRCGFLLFPSDLFALWLGTWFHGDVFENTRNRRRAH